MYKYLLFIVLLIGCDSAVQPSEPIAVYEGTCYFQNDSGRVSDTYKASLRFYPSLDGYQLGIFTCYDVRDTLIVKEFTNSAKVTQYEGAVSDGINSTQFAAQERLDSPTLQSLYYLPNKWRIFTVTKL